MKEHINFKYHPVVGNDEHQYCIDDFIKELQSISPDKRKLPLVMFTPNGSMTTPKVKMVFDDTYEYKTWDSVLGKLVAMTITYEN